VIGEIALIGGLLALLGMPHALPLHSVAPAIAAITWVFALAVRALIAIGVAVFVFVYLPQTEVFAAVASWCWHAILPLLSDHLSGHPLADAAQILPALALAASLLWVVVGAIRAGLCVERHIRARTRGTGPLGSTVVSDRDILVAVAGVPRARVVVSEGALGTLDPEELEASLTHEFGHLARRHRPVIVCASALAALARWLPGTRAVQRQLLLSLERDADEYAVARTRNPLALASAICKAAGTRSIPATALPLHRAGTLGIRLEQLVAGGRHRGGAATEVAARALAGAMIIATLALTITLPSWALAAPANDAAAHATAGCHV
jgi:hypothetical protein